MLVKWVALPYTLHWPQGGVDLGVGGVSYVELLLLYELWAGERLTPEKAQTRYLRPGRAISVSAVLFGRGIDIWRSCRFIGALMRSLCLLLGGLGRFVPCSIGANHCRLRHSGWEKSGHGLTSPTRESASELFLNELLGPGSGRALLAGTLPLRYCAARFAGKTPTWRFPVWVSGSGPGRKRIRLNRKTPAHLAGLIVQSRQRVWKRLNHVGTIYVSIPDRKRRRRDQDDVGNVPAPIRTGVG